jgi:coenzyme A diphosphatase NUDT7
MVHIEELQGSLTAQPCIQPPEEYLRTAVLVLLVFLNNEYHFVFQKRVPHIRQGGEICFPGGLWVPEDGSAERTAIRETIEELGIREEKLTVLGALHTQIAPLGAVVEGFVGTAAISSLEELAPNAAEVASIFTTPVSFFETQKPQVYHPQLKVHPIVVDEKSGKEIVLFPARELGLPDTYAKPWGGMRHTIYAYRVEQGLIWGITARFVLDLISKLKK